MDMVSITALPSPPTSNQVIQASHQPANTVTAFPLGVFLRWRRGRRRRLLRGDCQIGRFLNSAETPILHPSVVSLIGVDPRLRPLLCHRVSRPSRLEEGFTPMTQNPEMRQP